MRTREPLPVNVYTPDSAISKRTARGYGNFSNIRSVAFHLAGKFDFSKINPMPLNPLRSQKSKKYSL